MKLIKSSVSEIIESNPYKKVELIGRTCYKSEDKITETSCYKFVEGLVTREHFAMLEHARLTFAISYEDNNRKQVYRDIAALANIPALETKVDYATPSIQLNCSLSHLYNPKWIGYTAIFRLCRMIIEKKYIPGHENDTDINNIELIEVSPQNDYNSYRSFKFTCDRGVSHELVRHRCAVAQESTRYCNYAKDKFGGEITFIEPAGYEDWNYEDASIFENTLAQCEAAYMYMLLRKYTPQQARAVLPNALKTEVILTMNTEQWRHFINLRSKGVTGAPHPDMKVVADMVAEML